MSRQSGACPTKRSTANGSTFFLNFLRRKIREDRMDKQKQRHKSVHHPYKAPKEGEQKPRRRRTDENSPASANAKDELNPLTRQLQEIFGEAETPVSTAPSTLTTNSVTTTSTTTTTMYTQPIMTTSTSQLGATSLNHLQSPLNEHDLQQLMASASQINADSQEIIPSSQPVQQPAQQWPRRFVRSVTLQQMTPTEYKVQKISPVKEKIQLPIIPEVKVHIKTLQEAKNFLQFRTEEEIEKTIQEAHKMAERGKTIPPVHQCVIDSIYILNEETEKEETELNPPKRAKPTDKIGLSFKGVYIKTIEEAYDHINKTDKAYIDSHLDNVKWKQANGEDIEEEEQRTADAVRIIQNYEEQKKEQLEKEKERERAEKKKELQEQKEREKELKKEEQRKQRAQWSDKKNTRKLTVNTNTSSFESPNSFEALQSPTDDEDNANTPVLTEDGKNEEPKNNPQDPRRKPRKDQLPPLILSKINNFGELQSLLLSEVGAGKFECHARGPSISIHTKKDEDWFKIQTLLKAKGYSFHTYAREKARPIQLVIRYIHNSIDEETIKDALTARGYQVLNIHRVKREGEPTDEINIDLENNANAQDIKTVKQLLHHRVNIVDRRKPLVTICTRCSGYHHSRASCFKTPLCPKCGNKHPLSECTASEPNCPNCNEEYKHPATWRGCPTYKEEEKKIKEKRNTERTPRATPKPTHQNPWTRRPSKPKTPTETDINKLLTTMKTNNKPATPVNTEKPQASSNFLEGLIDTKDIMAMLTETLKETIKPIIASLIQWAKENLTNWIRDNVKTLMLNLIKECLPS
ncbi:hypothetical protein FOCC_FOCC013726 [Frankliniella occidentalis]|nr:hypothetical protein FOCC_FOCC013726 [Frankliniella occidentalis]